MKTEADIWREERERIERKARPPKLWHGWDQTLPEPEPDYFVWYDLADIIPVETTVSRRRAYTPRGGLRVVA